MKRNLVILKIKNKLIISICHTKIQCMKEGGHQSKNFCRVAKNYKDLLDNSNSKTLTN